MLDVVLATSNQNKIDEILLAFSEVKDINLCSLKQMSSSTQKKYRAEETGNSFIQNARIKAVALARLVNQPVLSEDSGLVIPAIGNKPGIHSKRYGSNDQERIQKIMSQLSIFQDIKHRVAFFVSVLCYMDSLQNCTFFIGCLQGHIALKIAGNNGFGYDPIFSHGDSGVTVAELAQEEKNRISHRGIACKRLIYYLASSIRLTHLGP